MSKFEIVKTNNSRIDSIDWDNLGFGVHFSDHVFISDYKDGKWDEGRIVPYGPMEYEPAMCTIHYGQSIFEGLKAFKNKDGGINLFRPDMNAKRLNRSAARLCMPEYSEYTFVNAVHDLVKLDEKFIPKTRGHSLYIRPVMYGTGNFLGVHESNAYRLLIMTSPVSSYYKEGLKPVKILVSHEFVRAVRGGVGGAKTAGNYAASLLAGRKAKELGYSQVLWLDGVSREFIDEVGAMNIMFVIDGEVITPPLEQGSILPGVTRNSVIQLCNDMDLRISERSITVDEVFKAHKDGKLEEVFGTGTAAVISPVGELNYDGNVISINDGEIGPIAQKFYDTITGIQYGEYPDIHRWVIPVR